MGLIAAYGDSGSWIVEKDSGKLCGHIVAGDVSTGLAYVIPAKPVFEQIERQLGCRIELSELGNVQSERSKTRTLQSDSPAGISDELMGKGKAKDTTSLQHSEFLFPISGTVATEQTRGSTDIPGTRPATDDERASRSSEPSTDTHRPTSMFSNTTIESGRDRENISTGSPQDEERDRDRRSQIVSVRTNEYWVPRDGIDHDVINADICRYLGNDARVRPGNYEVYLQQLANFVILLILCFRIHKRDKFSRDTSSQLPGT